MSEPEVFVCQPDEDEPTRTRPRRNGETIEAKRREPPAKQPIYEPPKPAETPEPAPEVEPEPVEEPEQPKETIVAQPLSMTPEQFESLLARVISETRKPVIDEMKVAQQKRTREHNRQMQKDNRQMQLNRFYNCNHMQLPGSVMSGCAAIAWATQSDGKRRGVCQHCGTLFSPERSECVSDEIWQAYKMLVRLPTHPSGNINNVFQSA